MWFDFIHEPPPLTSGAFAYDFYYYQWGRLERDFEVISAQALSDESAPLYQVFGQDSIIGITLSPETTPEIIKLCERATTDEYQAQLKKAREEYNSILGVSTRIDAPSADAATPSAALYDMNGRQLNEKPNKGVYIQSGQKFVSKASGLR